MSALHEEGDGLSVGDQMVLREGGRETIREVVPIVRLTKTQIIVDASGRQRRFSRHRLREVGRGGWYGPRLERATPELIAEIEAEDHRAALLRRIQSVRSWQNLPTDTLEVVVAALYASKAPASPSLSEDA